jgi:hypothetical protein
MHEKETFLSCGGHLLEKGTNKETDHSTDANG